MSLYSLFSKPKRSVKIRRSERLSRLKKKKQKAKTDSAKIISDAQKQVEKMLENDRQAIEVSIGQRLEKERKHIDDECAVLSETAEKNLDVVTETVVRSLVRH